MSVFRDNLLHGQVALVTGGGSGIGFGIAELLGGLGAHVVIASRSAERLEAAAGNLRAGGAAVSTRALDVRDAEQVHGAVKAIRSEHGRVDLLVNNAAGNFYAPSETMSPNAWRSVIEIDLYGTFFCSQAAASVMKEQGGGRIISISMTLHYRGWPMMAHATAAKAGIDALTRTLALEWAGYGIRVNAIAPGPIPTEGVRKAFGAPARGAHVEGGARAGSAPAADLFGPDTEQAMQAYARRAIPLGRFGTPRDIASMVAYLASPAADWITGAIFVVDGGEWLSRPQPPAAPQG